MNKSWTSPHGWVSAPSARRDNWGDTDGAGQSTQPVDQLPLDGLKAGLELSLWNGPMRQPIALVQPGTGAATHHGRLSAPQTRLTLWV